MSQSIFWFIGNYMYRKWMNIWPPLVVIWRKQVTPHMAPLLLCYWQLPTSHPPTMSHPLFHVPYIRLFEIIETSSANICSYGATSSVSNRQNNTIRRWAPTLISHVRRITVSDGLEQYLHRTSYWENLLPIVVMCLCQNNDLMANNASLINLMPRKGQWIWSFTVS